MENDVFRGLLFMLSGTTILSLELVFFLRKRKRRVLSTGEVKATVTSKYNGKRKYRPTYQYFAEGTTHRVASRSCYQKLVAEDGQTVDLYFIPGQPEKIYVPKEQEKQGGPLFFIVAGLIGVVHFCMGLAVMLGFMD